MSERELLSGAAAQAVVEAGGVVSEADPHFGALWHWEIVDETMLWALEALNDEYKHTGMGPWEPCPFDSLASTSQTYARSDVTHPSKGGQP